MSFRQPFPSALFLGVLVAFSAGLVHAKEIKGTFSGSSLATSVDFNGDGQPAASSETVGHSNLLGSFTSRALSELDVWINQGPDSFCSPTELRIPYLAGTTVYTAKNGDMLYTMFAEDSELCFNFLDLTFTGTVQATVTGGTGNFEGATGNLQLALTSGRQVPYTVGVSLVSVFSGTMQGDVTIPKKQKNK